MSAIRKSAGLALFFLASAAAAHDTHQKIPGWTLDPAITVPLLSTLCLFAIGWRRLLNRTRSDGTELTRRARMFAVGWLILAAALISPLHRAGERSFAVHMFEHELLMLAAAPILVLSKPLVILLWGLPSRARTQLGAIVKLPEIEASWRLLSGALAATSLQAATLWLWHMPALFDLALASDGWHAVQHVSFLFSALLFWTAMLARRTPVGVAGLCLVATAIITGALGALMAFATSPWYPRYAALGMAPFALTPAEDQQVAGLLMWVPGGFVHACVALFLMRRLLRPTHA